jgi:hypothetical protein
MVFAVILVATALVWSRIPTIVSGRFQFQFRDPSHNRSTSSAAPLPGRQVEQSATVPAASPL